MNIDGTTQLTGIIGYPISHTLSPGFQNAAFRHVGLNWVYVPLLVEPADLGLAVTGLKALNFRGVNVTMPYKQAVIAYLDELDAASQLTGAANTIEFHDGRLVGHNTDGQGFIASLEADTGFDPRGKGAVVVGAGGAARSVAVALAGAGLKSMTIVNRTPEKADELGGLISAHFPGCAVTIKPPTADLTVVFGDSELVVNATSVGMPENPGLPVTTQHINSRHVVYDIIYCPTETALLRQARERGARTVNGIRMLLYQGAAAFKIWTGLEPPVAAMSAALESTVSRGQSSGKSKQPARKHPA